MRRIEKRGVVNVLCDDDGNGCMPATRAEVEFFDELTRLRAEVEDLTADRDSWSEQASARTADAVQFMQERDAARAEVEALRGITPELPPRPPDGGGLPRYGLRHNGQSMPVSVPLIDGYWTPRHLAIAQVEALRADAVRWRWISSQGWCPFSEADDAWDSPAALTIAVDESLATDAARATQGSSNAPDAPLKPPSACACRCAWCTR